MLRWHGNYCVSTFSPMAIITQTCTPPIASNFSIPKIVVIQNIMKYYIMKLKCIRKLSNLYKTISTSSLNLTTLIHIKNKTSANMVGTRQWTNTSRKSKKSTKKSKKSLVESAEPKHVINMYRVKMKGVILDGKVDGSVRGLLPMNPLKEVKKKKLEKTSELSSKVPLSMVDLTRKGKSNEKKKVKYNKVNDDQSKPATRGTQEVIYEVLIQMVVLLDQNWIVPYL